MTLPTIQLFLFMGLVPMIVWTVFLWWLDHWEREPWYLIAVAFFWGAVPSIALAMILEYFVMMQWFSATIFYDPQATTRMAVITSASSHTGSPIAACRYSPNPTA